MSSKKKANALLLIASGLVVSFSVLKGLETWIPVLYNVVSKGSALSLAEFCFSLILCGCFMYNLITARITSGHFSEKFVEERKYFTETMEDTKSKIVKIASELVDSKVELLNVKLDSFSDTLAELKLERKEYQIILDKKLDRINQNILSIKK